VTGATGFLGRRLVRGLLARGERVTALVRAGDRAAARARLVAVLGEAYDVGTLAVVAGTLEDLPCAAEVLDRGPVARVWHTAALLDLGDRRSDDVQRTNVEGTRRVLALAEKVGARAFHHLSTAYVWGATRGTLDESLPPADAPHRNAYERSKWEGEVLVRAFPRPPGRSARIYRPGIVVGDATQGQADVYGAFYAFLRLCLGARGAGTLALPTLPQARLGLVPVDRVAGAMLELSYDEAPGLRTYHLTNPDPPLVTELVEVASALLGVPLRAGGAPSPRFHRLARPFLPYLVDESRFAQPAVDAALGRGLLAPAVPRREWARRLVASALRDRFGRDEATWEADSARLARLLGVHDAAAA